MTEITASPPKPATLGNRRLRAYVTGFVVSIGLTLAAYFAVVDRHLTGRTLIATIFVLAIAQLYVQLFFFLHMGEEKKPREKLSFFLLTLGLVGIIVGGTLWIMNNLDYRMMSPEDSETYMRNHEGL